MPPAAAGANVALRAPLPAAVRLRPFFPAWLTTLSALGLALAVAPSTSAAPDPAPAPDAASTPSTPSAPASPTEIPAGPLPRTVVPTHVAAELRIDPAATRFEGVVRIDVDVRRQTRTLWLHGKGLQIAQARVVPARGAPQVLDARQADPSGVLRLGAAVPIEVGAAQIELHYSAPFGELQGAYRVRAGDEDYVLTQFEAIGARTAMPAFDEPSFKVPWDLTLVVPEALHALANTPVKATRPSTPGWKAVAFDTTASLPSYLVAFAVGPWEIVDAPALPPNAVRDRAVPLRAVVPRGQGARARTMLQETEAIVAALETYFALPFPYPKLDLLAAPDFGPGAMENPGLIVYRDALLYADEHSPTPLRQFAFGTHAHELAHQWFGDLVTMRWWDDIWLNEAFATWMATKVVSQLRPEWHAERFLMESSLRAMVRDSMASTRRVREPVRTATDIESAFDDITYDKGGAVLSMIERFVGEARFRDGIRGYLRQHAGGNAGSADLVEAVAAASPSPAAVRAAFDSFLNLPGVPIVHTEVDCGGTAPVLHVVQRRFVPVGSDTRAGLPWSIPLCLRWGDASGATHEQCRLVDRTSTTLPLTGASGCPVWLMPNAAGAGYYRFAPSPGDAARLEAHWEALDAREQRAYADAVDAAFDAGVLDVAGYLRAAERIARAPERETATAPLRRLGWIREHLVATPEQLEALRAFVRRVYGPRLAELGPTPRADDTDDRRRLRNELLSALASLGHDEAVRAGLASAGRQVLGLAVTPSAPAGDRQLHPDAVAPDLRGLALLVAMREGGRETFDVLVAHLRSAEDTELREDLLTAISAAPEPDLRARARALALDPALVRRNEVGIVLGGGWRRTAWQADDDPALRAAGRDWVVGHFDELASRMSPYGRYLVNGYARGLCTVRDAERLSPLFAARVHDLDAGPRALAQSIEGVRLCAALADRQRTSASAGLAGVAVR
jgi:alanyl aminopeptidase